MNDRLNSDFMSPIEYWPKLLWLKNNLPEIYEKCAYILDANAFLKYRLTGEFVSDYNNCFIYSKNEKLQKRYDGVLRAAGLDKKKFALPADPSDIAGKVTPEAAAESGISAGVPVFGGTTDLVAVAIGSGCGAERAEYGQGHIYLGSSGWLGTVVPEGKHMFLPFRDGTDLALAAMQSAGLAFDWGARCFYGAKTSVGSRVYDEIESESGQIAPGCGRLLCVPWIHEETSPHDANARCVFFHAESGHTRAHFQTAIKEGVAFQLRQSSEILKGYGIPASPSLRAVGGCVASPDWMRRIADIMQTPIQVLTNARHAGAVGAAFCALSGLGVFRSLAEARETTEIECTYEPRVKTADEYAKLYEVWKELENALTHCNALLADQKEKFI